MKLSAMLAGLRSIDDFDYINVVDLHKPAAGHHQREEANSLVVIASYNVSNKWKYVTAKFNLWEKLNMTDRETFTDSVK